MVHLPRVIGIVGGLTWEATALYYDRLNRLSNARLRLQQPDSAHTVRILIDSLDFGEIEKLADREDWPAIGRMLLASAQRLEDAGAEAKAPDLVERFERRHAFRLAHAEQGKETFVLSLVVAHVFGASTTLYAMMSNG